MSGVRVHPTALIEDGVELGDGTVVWDSVHIRRGARVGRGCIVGEKTHIASGAVIGNLVKLNTAVYVCSGVTIGDGVMVAAHVVFTNDVRPRATDPEVTVLRPSEPGPHTHATTVGRGASIGANATIGPGLAIGAWAMVGMGAVVTRDVPAHGLVVGNPARLVGLVDRGGNVALHLERGETPPEDAELPCADGGKLRVSGGRVSWTP